jgi:S1-C subfamily serine protease
MQSYMETLGKLTPGQKTEVTILRGGKEIILPIEMNK